MKLFKIPIIISNVFITNVDLIHNQCRGDELKQDRKYYETLFKEKLNFEINDILFSQQLIRNEKMFTLKRKNTKINLIENF